MNVFDGWRQNDRRGSNPISHRVDRYLMVAGYITKDSSSTASYWPCFEGLRIQTVPGAPCPVAGAQLPWNVLPWTPFGRERALGRKRLRRHGAPRRALRGGNQPACPEKPRQLEAEELHWSTHVRPAQKAKPTDTVERRIGRKPMRTSGARKRRLVRNKRAPTPILQLMPGCFSQWNSGKERSK